MSAQGPRVTFAGVSESDSVLDADPAEEDNVGKQSGNIRSTYFGVEREGQASTGFGNIFFRRMRAWKSHTALMGKCRRSAITGDIHLRHKVVAENFPDYHLVDLWTRDYIAGTLGQLAADRYLFRPVPMLYRTWFYHMYYRRQEIFEGSRDFGMLSRVLAKRCIDAPVKAGRQSPIMFHGPMVFVLAIVGDLYLTLIGCLYVAIIGYIAMVANKPEWYWYSRLITLPVRLAFLGVIIWRFANPANTSVVAIVCFLLALVLYFADFLAGDVSALLNYRYHCFYEVVRILPHRIVMCKRHGAAHYEETFGSRGVVPEVVSGTGNWGKNFMLIADLNGILSELRPLSEEDWKVLGTDHDRDPNTDMFYVGLDVFNAELPSLRALMAADVKPTETSPKGLADVVMENL